MPPEEAMKGGRVKRCLYVILFFYVFIFLLRRLTPHFNGAEGLFPPVANSSMDDSAVNEWRANEARRYLQGYSSKYAAAEKRDDLTISIVTYYRPGDYLIQTVAYLLSSYEGRAIPTIFICDTSPKKSNDDYSLFHFLTKIPIEYVVPQRDSIDYRLEKENHDYWTCLNQSLAKNPAAKSVLLLEDDAAPLARFARRLDASSSHLEQHRVAYAKLSHPMHLRKLPSLPQEIALSVALSCLSLLPLLPDSLLTSRLLSPVRSPGALLSFALLTSTYWYYLHQFGPEFLNDVRASVSPSSSSDVYFSMPESCCTQAVLFRSAAIPDMLALSSVRAATGHAKDHILDESPFVGRMSSANFILHIGEYSTLRKQNVHLGLYEQYLRSRSDFFKHSWRD